MIPSMHHLNDSEAACLSSWVMHLASCLRKFGVRWSVFARKERLHFGLRERRGVMRNSSLRYQAALKLHVRVRPMLIIVSMFARSSDKKRRGYRGVDGFIAKHARDARTGLEHDDRR